MKGRDIINSIHKGKAPDMDAVYEKCISQNAIKSKKDESIHHTLPASQEAFAPIGPYERRTPRRRYASSLLAACLFLVTVAAIGFAYMRVNLDNETIGANPYEAQEPYSYEYEAEEPYEPANIARAARQGFLDQRAYYNNDDIIGRVWIPGTTIDYLVAQGTDNSFYLYHDLHGNRNTAGAIFLDYLADIYNANDQNWVIYGHNMGRNHKFHMLRNFLDEDFFLANRYIYFSTIYADYVFEVFASYVTHISFNYTRNVFDDWAGMIQEFMDRSLFDAGITVTEDDRVLTLSTCDHHYRYDRIVVQARLISESVPHAEEADAHESEPTDEGILSRTYFDTGAQYGTVVVCMETIRQLEEGPHLFFHDFMILLYLNPSANSLMDRGAPPMDMALPNWMFRADAVQALRVATDGMFFTSTGAPFEFIVQYDTAGRYRVNTRETVLFDAYGNEIGEIFARVYVSDNPAEIGGELRALSVVTLEDYSRGRGYQATINDVNSLLGQEVYIPTLPGFEPPLFSVMENAPTFYLSSDMTPQVAYMQTASVLYRRTSYDNYLHGLGLIIERARSESETPRWRFDWVTEASPWPYGDGTITRMVFHQRGVENPIVGYHWIRNGLVYKLVYCTYHTSFTDEEILEFILAFKG